MKKVALLLMLLPLLAGCGGGESRLRIGVVDTSRVLSELPEYQSMRMTVAREASDLFLESRGDGKPPTQEEIEQFRVDAQARSEEMNKRVQSFLEETIDKIRVHSEDIAAERGIDLVVADNPFTRSVQYYDGDDITTDIVLRMEKK
ncbi:MAG: OmpH family outer membrane protein [Armatimonadetes bacterium]|nr:OmpH family outer membrane protein [Armatimonadota bacterium]